MVRLERKANTTALLTVPGFVLVTHRLKASPGVFVLGSSGGAVCLSELLGQVCRELSTKLGF